MLRSSESPHRRRVTALVGCCLLLCSLAPTAALAQSAGDEQYADPLSGQDQGNGSESEPQGNPGSSGQDSGGDDNAGTPATAQDTPPPATAAQSAGGEASGLPRTGLDVAPVVAMGAALLLTGLIIHLTVGPARRRRRDPVVLFDGTLPPLR